VVKLSPLDRKLLRDLRRIGVQAVAVALLVACAVALFVGSAATWRALARSQARYYESHRFAEVFAEARRVPEPVAARISRLPGVAEVETRVVAAATVELPGDPAARTARALSLAPGGPRLNRVHVRAGRLPAPGAADEALVSEGFALANRLAPGDRIAVVIEGRRQSLRVAGVAISPEVVYALRPGDVFPDDRHFGILWLPLEMLAAAAGMEGAFDEVSLALAPGASTPSGRNTRRYGSPMLVVPLPLPGNGVAPLNVVPVDFVVEAALSLSRNPAAIGKTVHVVDPSPLSARKVYEMIAERAHRKLPPISLPHRAVQALLSLPVLERLSRFVAFYAQTLGALNRRLDYVDLRYPNGFALRVPEIVDSDTPRMAPASAWLRPSACTSSAVSCMPSPSFSSCPSNCMR